MIHIPFQSPASARGAALPAQQPRLDCRVARRLRFERNRWRAGDFPAGPGGAGPRLGIAAQHDHAGARPLRRQRQPPACRQVVSGKAALRFEQDQIHSRTARGLQSGAQKVELAVRVHDRQPGGIEAQQGQPVPIEKRLGSRAPPRQQGRPRLAPAASAQGKSQGGRLVVPGGMNLVQLPALQRGNRPFGARPKAPGRTFPKSENTSGHAPNRSSCSCYVLYTNRPL